MNTLTTSQIIRTSKATLMLSVSFFGILVMFSNFADYSTNYQYLAHVLSMDTTRDGDKYAYRAITSPMAHHRIYWLIITLEVIFTAFCVVGTYDLYKHINASSKKFHEAKKFAIVGLLTGIFTYYIFYQAIGTEWFNMDDSVQWNYKDWARHIVDFFMPLLIFIALRIER